MHKKPIVSCSRKQVKEDFSTWSIRTEHISDLTWLAEAFLCLENKEEKQILYYSMSFTHTTYQSTAGRAQ